MTAPNKHHVVGEPISEEYDAPEIRRHEALRRNGLRAEVRCWASACFPVSPYSTWPVSFSRVGMLFQLAKRWYLAGIWQASCRISCSWFGSGGGGQTQERTDENKS